MKKFIGEAYLLNVRSYEKDGKMSYIYEFLIGEQAEGNSGFLESSHVERCIKDHEAIKSGGSFMEIIKVAVTIKEFYSKEQGRSIVSPVYDVLDQ